MMYVASGIRSSFVALFAAVAAAAGCGDVAIDDCGPGPHSGAGGNGGASGGGGGQGGTSSSPDGAGGGGLCTPTVNCNYDVNCGMMDDGCGNLLDCDHTVTGQPATCAANGSPLVETGPMVCAANHVCLCPPEGNTAEAMAFCQGTAAEPAVDNFCVSGGGCDTALCGIFPVPKAPKECTYSGRTLKPVPLDESTWIHIWCCVGPA